MGINMGSIMEKVKEVAEKAEGEASLNRLFPSTFIQEHSSFTNIRDLLADTAISDQKSFDKWFDSGLEADEYIRKNTDFDSLHSMCASAASVYLRQKLNAIKDGTWTEENFQSDDIFDVICINLHLNYGAGLP